MRTLEGQVLISKDDAEVLRLQVAIDMERRNAIKAIKDEQAKLNLEYSQLDVKDSKKGKELKQQVGILGEQLKATEKIYEQHSSGMTRETKSQQNLKAIEEDRQRTLQNTINAIEEQIKRQEKLGEIQRNNNDQLKDLNFSKSLIGTGGVSKQIAEIQEKAKKGALEAGRAYSAAFQDTGDGLTPERSKELTAGLDQIALAYKKIADAQIDNLQASREWNAGWKEAFAEYMDNANNAADTAKQVFSATTSNMNSAIDKFVETGKLSFGDLARSIIQDILKIQLKKAAAGLFGSLFGIPGMAIGGQVSPDKPYIVGENGPELFMPTSAGSIIPNNKLGNSGGSTGGGTTIINNISAIDSRSVQQLFAEHRMTLFGNVEQARRELPMRTR
jgi:lambda family phage tail tape measure protein